MGEKTKDYQNMTKIELIDHIKQLNAVISEISKKQENCEDTVPWVGNLGQWNWMVTENQLVFNKKKATNLGYSLDEIPDNVGFECFTSILHPEDYQRVMENMKSHLLNKSEAFEVEYRIQHKDGSYRWYYDRGTITRKNKDDKAQLVSGIVFDITKNKSMEENLKEAYIKLIKLAVTDELTNAFNKRGFSEKLSNEMMRSNRTKSIFSLVMFDLDDFKEINDFHGHSVGDEILETVATYVHKRIRKTDTFARWGGDEFMLILPDTDVINAANLAEEIRVALNQKHVDKVEGIKASFGVIEYCLEDDEDTVLKKIDTLLYKAKGAGGNCVKFKKEY